jgi:hypothetical protein
MLLWGPGDGSAAAQLRPGDRVRLPGGPSVEYVTVEHPEVHLRTALALFGPGVRGVQAVWADDRGRWPWEHCFRGRCGGQPVLGPRAAC